MHGKRLLAPLALLGLFALAAAANAQNALQGSGTLDGADRLRVPGCGRQGGPVALDLTLDPTGAWSLDDGTTTYTGTSTPLTRRVLRLTPDAASLAALEAKLESDASALCEETVTITSLHANAALKVNKRRDRAQLYVRVRGNGTTASGDDGTGLYQLGARGGWSPSSL